MLSLFVMNLIVFDLCLYLWVITDFGIRISPMIIVFRLRQSSLEMLAVIFGLTLFEFSFYYYMLVKKFKTPKKAAQFFWTLYFSIAYCLLSTTHSVYLANNVIFNKLVVEHCLRMIIQSAVMGCAMVLQYYEWGEVFAFFDSSIKLFWCVWVVNWILTFIIKPQFKNQYYSYSSKKTKLEHFKSEIINTLKPLHECSSDDVQNIICYWILSNDNYTKFWTKIIDIIVDGAVENDNTDLKQILKGDTNLDYLNKLLSEHLDNLMIIHIANKLKKHSEKRLNEMLQIIYNFPIDQIQQKLRINGKWIIDNHNLKNNNFVEKLYDITGMNRSDIIQIYKFITRYKFDRDIEVFCGKELNILVTESKTKKLESIRNSQITQTLLEHAITIFNRKKNQSLTRFKSTIDKPKSLYKCSSDNIKNIICYWILRDVKYTTFCKQIIEIMINDVLVNGINTEGILTKATNLHYLNNLFAKYINYAMIVEVANKLKNEEQSNKHANDLIQIIYNYPIDQIQNNLNNRIDGDWILNNLQNNNFVNKLHEISRMDMNDVKQIYDFILSYNVPRNNVIAAKIINETNFTIHSDHEKF
eukprot:529127_1